MRPEEWAAFVALAGGASLSKAGELVDRKRGTVSGWVTKWRARWGQDLLRNRSTGGRPPEQSALGVIRAGEETRKRWAEIREVSAQRFGILSEEALDASLAVIKDHLADPERRRLLTISDAVMLARIAELAAKRADVLADVIDPTKAHLAGLAGERAGGQGAGLLAGLEAGPGAADGDTIAMLELVVDGFLHLVHGDGEGGAGPDEGFRPVEVTAVQAS